MIVWTRYSHADPCTNDTHTHTHSTHIFECTIFVLCVFGGQWFTDRNTPWNMRVSTDGFHRILLLCLFYYIVCVCVRVINKHFMMIFLIHFNNFSPRAKHSTYLCIATHSIILRCKSHFNEIFNGVVVGFVFNIEQSIISMANWTHI